MASAFLLQIIHEATGEIVAEWAPRENAPELLDDLLARVEAKGVGLFRTTEHVKQDIAAAWRETLQTLKDRV